MLKLMNHVHGLCSSSNLSRYVPTVKTGRHALTAMAGSSTWIMSTEPPRGSGQQRPRPPKCCRGPTPYSKWSSWTGDTRVSAEPWLTRGLRKIPTLSMGQGRKLTFTKPVQISDGRTSCPTLPLDPGSRCCYSLPLWSSSSAQSSSPCCILTLWVSDLRVCDGKSKRPKKLSWFT